MLDKYDKTLEPHDLVAFRMQSGEPVLLRIRNGRQGNSWILRILKGYSRGFEQGREGNEHLIDENFLHKETIGIFRDKWYMHKLGTIFKVLDIVPEHRVVRFLTEQGYWEPTLEYTVDFLADSQPTEPVTFAGIVNGSFEDIEDIIL